MKIVLLGMNHRTAPLELRERLAVDDPVPRLKKLVGSQEIEEAVLFSTCSVNYSDPAAGRAAVEFDGKPLPIEEAAASRLQQHVERHHAVDHDPGLGLGPDDAFEQQLREVRADARSGEVERPDFRALLLGDQLV